jgi:hypothetical protein
MRHPCRAWCRRSILTNGSTATPTRPYIAAFSAMNSYHLTGQCRSREAGAVTDVIGHSPKLTPRGMARLNITQKQATPNPARIHNPILRLMMALLRYLYSQIAALGRAGRGRPLPPIASHRHVRYTG